jgi:hypothetical protein
MIQKLFKSKKRIFIACLASLAIIVIIVAVIFAVKKPTSISDLKEELHTDNGLLRGSNGNGAYYLNTNETGIFYLDNNLMRYIDYKTKENYVLCSRADCKHNDENCGAYLANAFGFCAIEDQLFAWVENPENNTADLLRMDMDGENRSVLTSVSMGGHEVGEYELSQFNLSDIYYGFGKAYAVLTYYQVKPATSISMNGPCKRQVVTVDLATGKQSILFEQEGVDLFFILKIQAISPENIVCTVNEVSDGKDLDAFNEADNHELQEKYSDYDSYYNDVITKMNFIAYDYNFEDCSLDQFFDSPCTTHYTNGNPDTWYDPFFCLGWYENTLLACFETNDGNNTKSITLQQYNLASDSWNSIATIENSAIIMRSFGTVGNYILDDSKIFYMHYDAEPETTGYVCYYDLETHQTKELYEDAWNVTFRFSDEYQDYFVGDMMVNDKHGVYLIRKEDYYSGNLDQAELLLTINE